MLKTNITYQSIFIKNINADVTTQNCHIPWQGTLDWTTATNHHLNNISCISTLLRICSVWVQAVIRRTHRYWHQNTLWHLKVYCDWMASSISTDSSTNLCVPLKMVLVTLSLLQKQLNSFGKMLVPILAKRKNKIVLFYVIHDSV